MHVTRLMYIGQGMSTTMAGNYFFVSVDRKMFATDDSVYQAILSRRTTPTCDGPTPYTTYIHMAGYGILSVFSFVVDRNLCRIVVGKLSRRLIPERPTYTPGGQGAGVR